MEHGFLGRTQWVWGEGGRGGGGGGDEGCRIQAVGGGTTARGEHGRWAGGVPGSPANGARSVARPVALAVGSAAGAGGGHAVGDLGGV